MYKFGNQNTFSLNDNSNANKRSHFSSFTPSYTPANNSFGTNANGGFNVPSNSIFGALTNAPVNTNSFGTPANAPVNTNNNFGTPVNAPANTNSFGTVTFAPVNTNNNFGKLTNTPVNNFGTSTNTPVNNFGTSVNASSVSVNSTQTSDDNIINFRKVYSFNDVNIVPSLTTLKSKDDVSLLTKITKTIFTKIPIIVSSNNILNLIDIHTNGGIGIFKSDDFVEQLNYVKYIKKYTSPIDQTPITIYSNTTFDELKMIFNEQIVDYIAVVDQDNTCLGFIEKKNIETLQGNFYANEIMTPLNSMKFYKNTDYNWSDILTGPPNQELINSLNTVNIMPIVCDNKKLQGVMTLNNIINYYNNRSRCVLDNTGRLLSSIMIGVFDNYTERMERVDVLVKAGLDILYLNVDNAYNKLVFDIVKEIKQKYENLIVIVGNVNSVDAFKYICESGADCICVGNGTESGQFTLLQRCFELSKKYKIPIINNSGFFNENLNLIKSFSAGSSCILFKDNYKDKNLYIPDILESIQSGLLYVNCTSIENLHLSDIIYTLN